MSRTEPEVAAEAAAAGVTSGDAPSGLEPGTGAAAETPTESPTETPAATKPAATPAPKGGGMKKQALVYGAGEIVAKVVSFLMLPLYTSYLTPADYGVIALVDMTFNLVSIIAGARLSAGIFRFYHREETQEGRNTVVSTALILISGLYALIGLTVGLVGGPISHAVLGGDTHSDVIRIGAVAFVFQGLVTVPLTYVRALEKPSAYVGANVGRMFLQASLNWFFLAKLGLGLKSTFVSNIIAQALFALILGVPLVRATGLRFSAARARELLRFWSPLVATQLAMFVSTYGDRYFLQRAAGESVVGLYMLAYNFGFLLVHVGNRPFGMVWDNARFRVAKQENRDEVNARAFLYLNGLLLTVAAGIGLYARDVLRVMSQPAFHSAADLVPIFLAAYLLQCWTMMQDTGILVSGRTEYNTVANWAGGLTALALYALLIPRYHGLGGALATLVAFAVRYGVTFYYAQKLWPLRYRWAPVFRLLVACVAVIAASELFVPRGLPLPVAFGVRTLLLVAYLAALWVTGVLSPADRALVIHAVRSPRAALGRVMARGG